MPEISTGHPTNTTTKEKTMTEKKQPDYKTMRTKLRLNQTEFWSRVGVTQSCGSRYESGVAPVPAPCRIAVDLVYGSATSALNKLAKLRGVSVEDLVAKARTK